MATIADAGKSDSFHKLAPAVVIDVDAGYQSTVLAFQRHYAPVQSRRHPPPEELRLDAAMHLATVYQYRTGHLATDNDRPALPVRNRISELIERVASRELPATGFPCGAECVN